MGFYHSLLLKLWINHFVDKLFLEYGDVTKKRAKIAGFKSSENNGSYKIFQLIYYNCAGVIFFVYIITWINKKKSCIFPIHFIHSLTQSWYLIFLRTQFYVWGLSYIIIGFRPVVCPIASCGKIVTIDSFSQHFNFDHSKIPKMIMNKSAKQEILMNYTALSEETKCVATFVILHGKRFSN